MAMAWGEPQTFPPRLPTDSWRIRGVLCAWRHVAKAPNEANERLGRDCCYRFVTGILRKTPPERGMCRVYPQTSVRPSTLSRSTVHSRTDQHSPRRQSEPRPRGRLRERHTRATLVFGAGAIALGTVIGLGGGTAVALYTQTPAAASSSEVSAEDSAVTPAAQVIGLTMPTRPHKQVTRVATASVADIVLTPAARSRMAVAARAARSQERAQIGARTGWARAIDDGARLSSGFGQRWGRLHAGLDLAGPVGTSVRAMGRGEVTFAGQQSGYGNLIEVTLQDGTTCVYGHLDRIRVKAGEHVEPGQLIASLGNTGRSTGPHLHLEIRTPDGASVDPMPWLKARRIVPVLATRQS